jgi:DNA (cytosine-5)-methyltransferase 1
MSSGFSLHPAFRVVGAADAEIGKPSSRPGSLGCNGSYARNIGIDPLKVDLGTIVPEELFERLNLESRPNVLIACPPCTGFSRTLARNHLVDDARNSLVRRVGDFVRTFAPEVVVMENARELINGRFSGHYESLKADLEDQGYTVSGRVHLLSKFGLPQRRERALVIAARGGYAPFDLEDLWAGLAVDSEAVRVRRAIGSLPEIRAGEMHPDDPCHTAPRISDLNRDRMGSIPHDGGSWFDLLDQSATTDLLTPSMRRRAEAGTLGSHPDVYGRLWWDRPAPTIKRECGHIGNGRYGHPEQDRLCSVRELALLQGFPRDYHFDAIGLANMYRHVGDAVPPLIAHQMAALVEWSLGGTRPDPQDFVLPESTLTESDINEA